MAIYRGTVINRLKHNNIETHTNWYKTYQDAHKYGEELGKRKLGNNDNWFVRIDLKI